MLRCLQRNHQTSSKTVVAVAATTDRGTGTGTGKATRRFLSSVTTNHKMPLHYFISTNRTIMVATCPSIYGVVRRNASSLSLSSLSLSSSSNPFPVLSTTTKTTTLPQSQQQQHQVRFHSAYVSRHNVSVPVSAQIIQEYCNNHGLTQHKTNTSHIILRECPFCPKPTGEKLSNLYKLYICRHSGAYFCHRCGQKGSWYDFKANVNGNQQHQHGVGATVGANNTSGNGHLYGPQKLLSNEGRSNGPKSNTVSSIYTSRSQGGPSLSFQQQQPQPQQQQQQYPSTQSQGPSISGSTRNRHQQTTTTSTVEPLPLPAPRMSAAYSSFLLDPPVAAKTTTNTNATATTTSALPNTNNDPNGKEKDYKTMNNTNTTNTTATTTAVGALEYLLTTRGLNRTTLRKYGVGKAFYQFPGDQGYEEAECITFPWILKESEIQQQEQLRGATFVTKSNSNNCNSTHTNKEGSDTNAETATTTTTTKKEESNVPMDPFLTRRIKARAVHNKAWQRLDPPGGGWGLFGWHTVPDDATSIVLTEGEYDAMAVSQATGRPAVSLPNGCRSLPVHVLPLLERFDKIYLWMDQDGPGQEGAEAFGKKLGVNRCHVVQCQDAKDANEALLKGLDLESFILQARVAPHERLLTFQDLRHDVLHELLEPDQYKGTPIPSLKKFTDIIKGFRRGEMTVLTGPTGSGKTTFLGQISLDLAEQGTNVLWGSFEIKNTRLLHKLLRQHSRDALPAHTDPNAEETLNLLADRFETLPLHFMKFHGGSDIDEVLDAMEYAVYVHDTEHIILDNMQFMISRGSMGNSNFEKFDVQDIAIEKFRKFATHHNVHLTLVVHPRKEDETSKLNMSSFYGSAKATQEADTVLILQHDGRRKYIDVKKNRFDGTLGCVGLSFVSKSGRYVEEEGGSGQNAVGSIPTSIGNAVESGSQPSWMKKKEELDEDFCPSGQPHIARA